MRNVVDPLTNPLLPCHALTLLIVNAVHCVKSLIVPQPGKLFQPVLSERIHFGLFTRAGLYISDSVISSGSESAVIAEGPGLGVEGSVRGWMNSH